MDLGGHSSVQSSPSKAHGRPNITEGEYEEIGLRGDREGLGQLWLNGLAFLSPRKRALSIFMVFLAARWAVNSCTS